MFIQIYEIQTPQEAEAMVRLDVDHIGTVIPSPRHCQNQVLKATVVAVQAAGAKSSMIPLFRDRKSIAEAITFYQPDIIHFCETLTASAFDPADDSGPLACQAWIREKFPHIAIMRSIPIPASGANAPVNALNWARAFEPISDYFLTDTLLTNGDVSIEADQDARQPVNGYVGITGKTCNWDIAAKLVKQSCIPVVLAGGIGPENAIEGIVKVKPAGVDSCTLTNAVDTNGCPIRFIKDPAKVKALVNAVRLTKTQIAGSDKPLT